MMSAAGTELLVCERCDTVHALRETERHDAVHCVRCDGVLYRPHPLRADIMLAITVTGLLSFVLANVYPVISLSAHGQKRATTLLHAVFTASDQQAITVATICLLSAFALPLLELVLYAWVLVPLRSRHLPFAFRPAMRSLRFIRSWSMVEVFLLASIVSAVKLGGLAEVTPEIGIFGFGAVAIALTTLRTFHLRDIWAASDTALR